MCRFLQILLFRITVSFMDHLWILQSIRQHIFITSGMGNFYDYCVDPVTDEPHELFLKQYLCGSVMFYVITIPSLTKRLCGIEFKCVGTGHMSGKKLSKAPDCVGYLWTLRLDN